MKTKKIFIWLFVLIIILVIGITTMNKAELKSIRNEKELNKFYEDTNKEEMSLLEKALLLPFSILLEDNVVYYNNYRGEIDYGWEDVTTADGATVESSSTKDYSKTNVQVEGVDEADIIKTDGDYIYSISGRDVIITNVKNEESIKVESVIQDNGIANDLLLYKDKLVVISSSELISYYKNDITIVQIYNIKDKSSPKLEKSFELYEPYNTTRCIDGRLFVLSTGYLRKVNDYIMRDYKEDYTKKTIPFKNIKYLKNHRSNFQTLIAEINLDKLDNVKVDSYLIDAGNIYVSENNIYFTKNWYGNDKIPISSLFGLRGVFGVFDAIDNSYKSKTDIVKLKISDKKGISFVGVTTTEGDTINQYSLDEKDGNLRIALNNDEGSRVEIYDKNLKLLGKTDSVAEGEIMYSTRFMGNKAYLVTYQNTDPLFVLDLSDVKNPKVVGELSIPGYSTYLHPYDETHLIGIGMETEEVIHRDNNGRVTYTTAYITGMKMSLFDVSDMNNPKEISKTTIGDRRTVSAILTNPKALLFSKEKNLLAIPVNDYKDDFSIEVSDNVEEEVNSFISKCYSYISEGYFVYHIDLKGFELKGIITHEKSNKNSYLNRQLRGLYIDNNLYTVSEDQIKVNNLNTLEEINSINLSEKGELKYE